jgi:hypothetical protein
MRMVKSEIVGRCQQQFFYFGKITNLTAFSATV